MSDVFLEIRTVHAYGAHLRLIAAKSEKIPFFGRHQKKAAPKMQAARERTRGECTRVLSRARSKSHNK